ncbi:MAG TPA: PilZ domain-containing protein [Terriglobales bacterium]|nr:PilZ domain-containing protein [Terriglobales bacterium]
MNQPILEGLVVASDAEVVNVFSRSLNDMGLRMEAHADAESAVQALSRKKFDVVIVDCGSGSKNAEILKTVRWLPSNNKAVVVAVAGEGTGMREAFASGADFVLSKPVQQEQATRTLWAGYGSMLRERRRYFRHRLDVPAEVQLDSGEKTPARTLNVSESGLAISANLMMRAGQKIWFSFTLPETNLLITGSGQIVWTDGRGQAGVHFEELKPQALEELKNWLALKFLDQVARSTEAHFVNPENSQTRN